MPPQPMPPRYAMNVIDRPSIERFRASSDFELKLVTIWSLGTGRVPSNSPSLVMLFGNAAALLGVVVAAGGIFAAGALSRPELDGVASILIGVILAVTSLFLARESKSLLIGEETYPIVRNSILKIVNAEPAILTANGIITTQLAPNQVIVVLSIEFADALRAPQIEQAVIALETKVRAQHPEVVGLFVKPQTERVFRQGRRARIGKTPSKRRRATAAEGLRRP